MARRSAPRSSRCVANECRSTCGLSVRGRPAPPARSRFRIFQKPTRLSGSAARVHEQPRRLRAPVEQRRPRRRADSARPTRPPARRSARSAPCCPCRCRSGTRSSRCRSAARRPTSSETRIPVAYSSSIMRAIAQPARRRRRRAARCSASTSSSDRNFGSAGHARGGRRSSAGLRVEPAVEHEEAVEAADRGDRRAPPSAATGPRVICSRTNASSACAVERLERRARRRRRTPPAPRRSRA